LSLLGPVEHAEDSTTTLTRAPMQSGLLSLAFGARGRSSVG